MKLYRIDCDTEYVSDLCCEGDMNALEQYLRDRDHHELHWHMAKTGRDNHVILRSEPLYLDGSDDMWYEIH